MKIQVKKQFELIKNTLIILFGKMCTQFASFLLLPLYTTKLTTEQYGIVDVITTYVFLIVPVITLELQQSAFRFLIEARKDEKRKKDIVSNIMILSFLQIVLFIIIYQIVCRFAKIDYQYYLAINVISTILSSVSLQIARGLGDNKVYAIGSAISAITNIALNVILIVAFNFAVRAMLISLFIGNMFCVIYIYVKMKLYKYIQLSSFSKRDSKEMLRYSIPLVPNSVSWWVVSVSDRTIINVFLGMAANGLYAVANKFTTIFSGIYMIFNLSCSESASVHINEKDRDEFFNSVINNVIKIFSCLCCCVVAAMPFIFNILIKEDYKDSYYYIPILFIGALFNIIVGLYGSIYIALKKTDKISTSTIIAAIINILTNLVFIKYIGLYAASISTAIAYLVIMIYRHLDIKKYINIKLEYRSIMYTFLILVLLMFMYYYNNIYINCISLIIAITYSLVTNRNSIRIVIKESKKKIENIIEKNNKNQNI